MRCVQSRGFETLHAAAASADVASTIDSDTDTCSSNTFTSGNMYFNNSPGYPGCLRGNFLSLSLVGAAGHTSLWTLARWLQEQSYRSHPTSPIYPMPISASGIDIIPLIRPPLM